MRDSILYYYVIVYSAVPISRRAVQCDELFLHTISRALYMVYTMHTHTHTHARTHISDVYIYLYRGRRGAFLGVGEKNRTIDR